MPRTTLWPDDEPVPTSRDGVDALMDGRFRYFLSRNLLQDRPDVLEEHKIVLTDFIRDSGGTVEFLTTNIDAAIARRAPTIKQKLDRMMRGLARRTQYQAGTVNLWHDRRPMDLYPLLRDAGARDIAELKSLLRHGESLGFTKYLESSTSADAEIKIPGILYVEDLATPSSDSRSAFVAMWFSAEMTDAYQSGMVPAIEANGYEADRVDQREFNHKVDDEIISRVRAARFVVADFSCGKDGARGGVYFEAGFALALDKPVIFTVRAADLSRAHFDTRQFNHIVWETPIDLEEKLRNRIGRTVGCWVGTPSS